MLAAIARLEEANLRQLEEALAIDQTTLTRSLGLLERDGLTERVAHPDRRIKAMRLTPRGRAVLRTARPLWSRAQEMVLRELGSKGWADARRRLAHLRDVAVRTRRSRRTRALRPRGASRPAGCSRPSAPSDSTPPAPGRWPRSS